MRKFRSGLLASEEAQRQLTMGKLLDPKHPIANPVPILEEIFNDSDLYTKPSADVIPSKFHPVTPDSSFVGSAKDIRGCNSLVVNAIFEKHILRRCGTWQNFGNTACVYYFPPWHEMCQTRRSRPAMVGVRSNGLPFNGEDNEYVQKFKEIQKKSNAGKNGPGLKSVNPMDYAMWRQASVRTFRQALFNAFYHPSFTSSERSSDGIPTYLDGMYFVTFKKIPSQQEADKIMLKFLNKVAKSDRNWADRPLGLNLTNLERTLMRNKHPVIPKFTRRTDWQL